MKSLGIKRVQMSIRGHLNDPFVALGNNRKHKLLASARALKKMIQLYNTGVKDYLEPYLRIKPHVVLK